MGQIYAKSREIAVFIRDLVLIAGAPAIAYVALQMHSAHVEALKDQNAALKERLELAEKLSYDRALCVITSQKTLFEGDKKQLQETIDKLSLELRNRSGWENRSHLVTKQKVK